MHVPPPPPNWYDAPPEPTPTFAWTRLSDIPERPIQWVDYPFLQGSAFHLLAGVKNAGKGTWLANAAARVTRGELGPNHNVLWVALGEDSYSVDVRPRVRAAGGVVEHVDVLTGWGFQLPDHGQMLEDQIREREAGLVVLDPLGGTLGGKRSTNHDFDVRPVLQALNYMADATGTMIFGVRHVSNKAGQRGDGVLSGVLGSSDWVNIPRAVLALIHDDVDPGMRHLFSVASNRGPADTPGQMIQIEGVPLDGHEFPVTTARVIGESHKDPDELLSIKRTRQSSRSDTARVILCQVLLEADDRTMESDALDAEVAQRTGLSARTIRNLRMALNKEGLIRARPVNSMSGAKTWEAILTNAGAALATNTPLATPLTPTGSSTPTTEVIMRESRDSGLEYNPPFAGETADFAQSRIDFDRFGTLGHVSTGESPESRDPRTDGTLGDPGDSGPPQLPPDAPDWERQFWNQRNGGQP
jgi:AAA domain